MHFIRIMGYTLSGCKINYEIMRELQIPQTPEFMEHTGSLQDYTNRMSSDRMQNKILHRPPPPSPPKKFWKDL
jgi:hypothetical protein